MKKSKILVIGAHPDDETLGVGGTILKKQSEGYEIYVCILSESGNARKEKNIKTLRKTQLSLVAKKLKLNKLYELNFPEIAFDTVPQLTITQSLEKIISEIQPEEVFTHFPGDINIDHRITGECTLIASRFTENNKYLKRIFFYEIFGSSGVLGIPFTPNWYEDITKYINMKRDIFSIYNTEVKQFPHPRSIHGIDVLSQVRGMESGFHHAEGFMLYKSRTYE